MCTVDAPRCIGNRNRLRQKDRGDWMRRLDRGSALRLAQVMSKWLATKYTAATGKWLQPWKLPLAPQITSIGSWFSDGHGNCSELRLQRYTQRNVMTRFWWYPQPIHYLIYLRLRISIQQLADSWLAGKGSPMTNAQNLVMETSIWMGEWVYNIYIYMIYIYICVPCVLLVFYHTNTMMLQKLTNLPAFCALLRQ